MCSSVTWIITVGTTCVIMVIHISLLHLMLLQVPDLHFACLQTDMEEAKTQENRKLQQQLQELQLQSKETKDLLKREQEVAKEALEKAALVPEVKVDTTLIDKLTAENENLKVSP